MSKTALVVGINRYPIKPLKCCENDATSVASLLSKNGDKDETSNFTVRLETEISTRADLRQKIIELFQLPVETALFYFSGHGSLNDWGGYLLTPDHEKFDEGISMDEILQIANHSKAKNKILILDCCFSGAMGERPSKSSSTYLEDGVTILTASRQKEFAYESRGHGVFTSLLISALEGGAANMNGDITPGGIYAFIDQALGAYSQRPLFKSNVNSFIRVRSVSPLVSFDTLRKIPEFFTSPEKEFDLNPSFEYKNDPTIPHVIVEPYANPTNTVIFKRLQNLCSAGLVIPVGADHMYFAAMESKSCKLTRLGQHYWHLAKDRRL